MEWARSTPGAQRAALGQHKYFVFPRPICHHLAAHNPYHKTLSNQFVFLALRLRAIPYRPKQIWNTAALQSRDQIPLLRIPGAQAMSSVQSHKEALSNAGGKVVREVALIRRSC